MKSFTLFIITCFYVYNNVNGAEFLDIAALYENLFKTYQKDAIPNANSGELITVNFSAFLIQLIDVDEKHQVLTLNLWIEMIEITHFPYDEQECKLKFGGWTYTGLVMDLQPVSGGQPFYSHTEEKDGMKYDGLMLLNGMDLSYFQESHEWDLMNLTSARFKRVYLGCCGQEYYIDITYYITLRRKALFYTVNLVIPCILIAFLTTFVFYLTDHKMTFAISIMVALSVFWLVLVDLIPPNSEVVPLLAKYLMFTMSLVTMSIMATVVVLNIQYRNSRTHEMSPWIREMFLRRVPKYLGLNVPEWRNLDIGDAFKRSRENRRQPEGNRREERQPLLSDLPAHVGSCKFSKQRKAKKVNLKDLALAEGVNPAVLQRMINQVNRISDHFAMEEDEVRGSEDWTYVAFVINRLFLILFTTINVVGSVWIMAQAPLLYDHRKPLVSVPPTKPLGGDILAKRYEID